jgi:potassium efflux system protein
MYGRNGRAPPLSCAVLPGIEPLYQPCGDDMIGSHSITPFRHQPVLVKWYVLLVLCVPWFPGMVVAEDNPLTVAEQQLRDIKQELEQGVTTGDRYDAMKQDIDRVQKQAQACIDDAGQQGDKIAHDLESLGAAVAGEDATVTRARRDLEKNKSTVEKKQTVCRLLHVNADELAATIAEQQKLIFKQQIMARDRAFTDLMQDDWGEVSEWLAAVEAFIIDTRGLEQVGALQWVLLFFLALMGVALGQFGKRRLLAVLPQPTDKDDLIFLASVAFGAALAHYLPWLLPLAVTSGSLLVLLQGIEPLPNVLLLGLGLTFYVLTLVVVRGLFNPPAPASLYLPVPEAVCRALAHRLYVLATLLLIGFFIFSTILLQQLPDAALLLTRTVFSTVLVINLGWVLWLVGELPVWRHTAPVRLLIILALFAGLIAEWAGYRNLSGLIIGGLVNTLLLFAIIFLLARVMNELYDGMDEGRYRWQQRFRTRVGLKPGEIVPGLVWLRAMTQLMLWGGFLLLLLRIWGYSDEVYAAAVHYVVDGFDIGKLHVAPLRVVMAVVLFSVLASINSGFKRQLDQNWLKKTRLDRGARDAAVTTSGYVGIAVAILVALSVAGVEFTNLAIIAGALSVGIGFGLQNIVNNFVSGLILLVERPIRTGDWIVVGDTEGYVKKISIRSTQIQTFDRADVIVPNSELIAGQVTNWMLSDPWGRVKVPVGVAYGSDTARVMQILVEVANKNPQVMNNYPGIPDPKALFLGFGDSSLDFELRCFIRDVDRRLQARSDLNLAIDAAFREAGIEIPFPQRDLHFRNVPPSGTKVPAGKPPDA